MARVQSVLDAISAEPDLSPGELLVLAIGTAARLDGDAGALELERLPAEVVYVAQAGDTLDLIAHRRYGTAAAVRHIQAANPELTGLAPQLAAGTRVLLPDVEVTPVDETKLVQLWD